MSNKYKNIIIPEELDFMTQKTIRKHKRNKRFITSLTSVAAALVIFTTSLNVSYTFAESMQQIPIVKDIASMLTFRTYENQTDEITSTVTIPSVSIEESNIDDFINETISSEVERILEEAQVRAEEYKDAYISTGGTEEGYKEKNMTVAVDYEVFSQDENHLSFRVFTHETLAAVYAENLYFTLDLNQRKILSLEDLLGENYVEIMTEKVLADIEEDAKENPNKYFDDYKSPDFKVRSDIDFYLKDNKLFIVFWKYELAAGAFGRLEFEIPMN
ncbi:DUF3298 domain-containing protein [Acidaminobacter sp. JC074]|uniref:RsiV family protein n=1 Tax=Acidaminobacter sp. JC074 TaxID=2530199 RepID=UPI001F0F23F5|nr:RsiV family protein [Acidaminobacter sp. JC074]MCH4886006.1 DUF3298 domain-containing protein [Acidaminobacter sp. JC074]